MKNKGVFYSLLAIMLWGALFPLVKLGYKLFNIGSGMGAVGDILTFAGLRFLICGVIICIFAYFRDKKSYIPLKNNWGMVLVMGAFAIVLHYAFQYIGLNLTGGSKTAILKQLGAIFYICFAALFFPDDKLTLKKISGLILGIGGIIAINIGSGGFSFGMGDVLIIGASFCGVFSNIAGKKVFANVEPITATGISQAFGGAVLLAFGVVMGGSPKKFLPSNASQLILLVIIIFISIISYCVWYTVVKKENLSNLFIIKFSEPLFSALFSFLIINEDIFKWQYAVAFLLITSGVFIANIKDKIKGEKC